MLFRAPPPLWTAVFLVLAINLCVFVAYRTGFGVMSMLKVPFWPKLSAKPMARVLRNHVLWGIVACLVMFGGSYQLLLQGQHMDALAMLTLVGAFLVLLTGFVRLYFGGSGRWHLYIACVAILVFAIRLLVNVDSLGAGFLAMTRPAPAQVTATDTAALAWRENILATVTSAGTRSGQKTLGVVLQGALTGNPSGKAIFTINEVGLNQTSGGVTAELSGIGKLETAGSGSYQGKLLGVLKTDGTGELLLNFDGLEAVATFNAPVAWSQGDGVALSLEAQPGGNLPAPAFRSATTSVGTNSSSPAPSTKYNPASSAPAPVSQPAQQPSQPAYTPPPSYAQPQSGC